MAGLRLRVWWLGMALSTQTSGRIEGLDPLASQNYASMSPIDVLI